MLGFRVFMYYDGDRLPNNLQPVAIKIHDESLVVFQ